MNLETALVITLFKLEKFLYEEGMKFWKAEQFKDLWIRFPGEENVDVEKVDWKLVKDTFFET